MVRNSFDALFGDYISEDAGTTPSEPTRNKSNLVPLRPPSQAGPAKEGSTPHIRVDQIVAKEQHRAVFEDIEQLAASIDAHGLIQPLLVRYLPDQTFELVAGERRLRAVQHLKLDMVPCIVEHLDDGQVAALRLAENLNRKDLNSIEEAKAFQDVIAKNKWTLTETAKRYGRDKGTVSRLLQLLELPDEFQQQIIDGKLSPRRALSIAKLPDADSQMDVMNRAREQLHTVEQTEQLVDAKVGKKRRNKKRRVRKELSFPLESGRTWRVPVGPRTTYVELEQDGIALLEEIRARLKARIDIH